MPRRAKTDGCHATIHLHHISHLVVAAVHLIQRVEGPHGTARVRRRRRQRALRHQAACEAVTADSGAEKALDVPVATALRELSAHTQRQAPQATATATARAHLQRVWHAHPAGAVPVGRAARLTDSATGPSMTVLVCVFRCEERPVGSRSLCSVVVQALPHDLAAPQTPRAWCAAQFGSFYATESYAPLLCTGKAWFWWTRPHGIDCTLARPIQEG
jgi:hypothetical protein